MCIYSRLVSLNCAQTNQKVKFIRFASYHGCAFYSEKSQTKVESMGGFDSLMTIGVYGRKGGRSLLSVDRRTVLGLSEDPEEKRNQGDATDDRRALTTTILPTRPSYSSQDEITVSMVRCPLHLLSTICYGTPYFYVVSANDATIVVVIAYPTVIRPTDYSTSLLHHLQATVSHSLIGVDRFRADGASSRRKVRFFPEDPG